MKKELGSFPADFEEWFLMWDSVLFFPNAEIRNIPLYGHTGEVGSIPCHKHRSCGALVKADSPYPPRTCPHCKVDTLDERKKEIESQEKKLWLPSVSTL